VRFMHIILAVLAAGPAAAQQPDDPPSQVPVEFVHRLAMTPFGKDGTILVGRLAAGVADVVDARDMRVVGALDHPSLSRNAAVAAGPVDAVRQRLREHVESAGWARMPRDPMDEGRGFLTSESEVAPEGVYCSPDRQRMVFLGFSPHGADSTEVDIVHVTGMYAEQCSASRRGVATVMADRMALPVLRPPAGALITMTSRQGSGGEASTSARMTTTRPLREIALHYAAGMQVDGWTAREPLIGADGVMQSFQRSVKDGAMHALLVIYRMSGERHQLRLDFWREDS
jgi:hypothetical protein